MVWLSVFCCVSIDLSAADGPRFGPYVALTINHDVIRGVKVDEENRIWLLLNPAYKEKEIILRISEEESAGYRRWLTGEYELISPANQGKQANEWTDWIRTQSPFIEYWMNDQLVLHLKRLSASGPDKD